MTRGLPSDGGKDRLARDPRAIRAMFSRVARRYDLLNRVLSLRQDVGWRRRLVGALARAPEGPVLDLACGTGDVALAVRGRDGIGADFCLDMLALARRKGRRRRHPAAWAAADALALPFRDGVFAAVTVAFGVRNFADLGQGLAEISRVLQPAGILGVLEFHRSRRAVVARLSALWNRWVVAPVGGLISDDASAYAYLPASVGTFAHAGEFAEACRRAGLVPAEQTELSGGIAVLTVAHKGGPG